MGRGTVWWTMMPALVKMSAAGRVVVDGACGYEETAERAG